jgi:amino acid transporter
VTELKKELGLLQLFTFGFGTIVGIAWVVLMGQLLASAGLVGTAIGLSIGVLMMMLIALCYAEMGTRFPLAGGEVAYVRAMFGIRTANFLGWFLLLSCLLVCGFEMVSVGWILSQLWPGVARIRLYRILGADVYLEPFLVSLAVQAIIAAANLRGVKEAGRLQAFTTGAKIALSVCFIAAGLRVARAEFAQPLFVFDDQRSVLPGIISVVTIAPFWFSGFNAVSQTLSERSGSVSSARATRIIVISLAAAWLFYCLVLLSMSVVMPRADLLAHPLPTAAAFQAAFGSPLLGNVVLFAGLLGLVSTWNALFFSSTRILMVLGSEQFVPKRFALLHPRHGTPGTSIIMVALIIPLIALLGRGAIGPVLNAFSVVMAGIYAAVCLALLKLRKRDDAYDSKSWLPAGVLPYCALMMCAAIALFALIGPVRDVRHGQWPIAWLAVLAWGAMGVGMARRSVARCHDNTDKGESDG